MKIGIIGGGASGMMAAIAASYENAEVTIFEKKDRLGKKLLVTGNGRCNFTNESMGANYYYTDNENFVEDVLNRFDNSDLVSFFNKIGVISKNKNGYIYPASEQASTVLEAFEYVIREHKIDVHLNAEVISVINSEGAFVISLADGNDYKFDRVIISSGAKSSLGKNELFNGYNLARGLGHSITQVYPALTPLKCSGWDFKQISGVRADCKLTLLVDDESVMEDYGEVLFNDNGLSGIVTFQISHCALENARNEKNVNISLDLLPGMSEFDLSQFINLKYLTHSGLSCEEFMTGILNKKLNLLILNSNGIDCSKSAYEIGIDKLKGCIKDIKAFKVTVKPDAGYDKSQVTGGGIPLSEMNNNFESTLVKGLYITGELLNVDGICGGYNLQWAFSSGYIAGEAAAK